MQKSSSRLLRALGLTEADDPQDGMLPGPLRDRLEWAICPNPGDDADIDVEAELRKLVAAVGELEALAKMARADAVKGKGKGKGEHKGNKALNEFITNLMLVYQHAGAEPGVSRNPKTGVPSGPTLRFVRACLKHLVENVSCADPALVGYIPNQSDEALAKRIMRAKPRPANSISKKT